MSKITLNESGSKKEPKTYYVKIKGAQIALYQIPLSNGGILAAFLPENTVFGSILIQTDDTEKALGHLYKEFDAEPEADFIELIEVEKGPKIFIPDNKILN